MPRDENIIDHDLVLIDISSIKLDKDNPNVMTDGEMNSLRANMKEFGFLQPIIVNKNMKLIDGEHRLQVYKEYNKKKIKAYVLQITDAKARLLRQGMNKIGGTHDPSKDISELQKIVQAGLGNELALILNKSSDTLTKLVNRKPEEIPTQNTPVEISFDIQHRCIVPGCKHGKEE